MVLILLSLFSCSAVSGINIMDSEKDNVVTTDNDDESTRKTLQPWSDRWKNKRIGFHLKEVNPILVKYASDLLQLPSSNRNTCESSGEYDETTAAATATVPSPIRVFVPLCGKAVDTAYLATAAARTETETSTSTLVSSIQVVGLEGIRVALEEFIEEHPNLNISREAIPRTKDIPFERFVGSGGDDDSNNGMVSLWKGDYFDLAAAAAKEQETQSLSSTSTSTSSSSSIIGTFGAIYDRASIVAIEPDRREDYVRILDQLLEPGGRILMVALERVVENANANENDVANANAAAATKKGPPYSVPESTIRKLFGRLGKHNEHNNNINTNTTTGHKDFDYSYKVELLQETDQLVVNPRDRERYPDLDRLLETVYLIRKEVVQCSAL